MKQSSEFKVISSIFSPKVPYYIICVSSTKMSTCLMNLVYVTTENFLFFCNKMTSENMDKKYSQKDNLYRGRPTTQKWYVTITNYNS